MLLSLKYFEHSKNRNVRNLNVILNSYGAALTVLDWYDLSLHTESLKM